MIDQRLRSRGGGNIAADHLDLGEGSFDPLHPVKHALRVAVCGIDNDHIHAGFHKSLHPLLGSFSHTHRSTDPQFALLILACVGVFCCFENVFYCYQAA